MEMPLPEMGKTQSTLLLGGERGSGGVGRWEGRGVVKGKWVSEFRLGQVKFEISIKASTGNAKFAITCMNLSSGESLVLEIEV